MITVSLYFLISLIMKLFNVCDQFYFLRGTNPYLKLNGMLSRFCWFLQNTLEF